ncbi:MAG: PhoH family protein [Balneolales bacterium]
MPTIQTQTLLPTTSRYQHINLNNNYNLLNSSSELNLNEQSIIIEGVDPVIIFGLNDEILKKIDDAYPDARLTARGNELKVTGSQDNFNEVKSIVQELIRVAKRTKTVSEQDVNTVIALKKSDQIIEGKEVSADEILLHTHLGAAIRAKTPGQKRIVDATKEHDIVFAIGPAGTGKTYTSVALAVRALKERKIKKIVLVRPAVEAGESLGFLPGDLKEKIDPYLRPLYDALEEMIEFERLEQNLSRNIIEIAPLAYMRGRTLNNAYVILDEAQNATQIQMKMFLTRLGLNSRAIVTGDITQTDLPKRQESGLMTVQKVLEQVEGVSFVHLGQEDVVRHKLVRDIIDAYEKHQG